MSPERFDHLVQLLKPAVQKKPCPTREVISVEERLAVTLRYLATGDSQQSQAFNFRIGRATVCHIVRDVCAAIWDTLSEIYLKAPTRMSDWESIADDFTSDWDFPNVIGALDEKHIAMECPKLGGSKYYNYKQFHSLVLMAMCDSKYCFTYVDIGGFGSDNDAGLFSQTALYEELDNCRVPLPAPKFLCGYILPPVIVADDIFPLKPWLMKPFPGKNGLKHEEKLFNYRLSRSRRTIENAFGFICKWRIFKKAIRADVNTVESIIKACVCLHNYLLLTDNSRYTPSGFVDRKTANGNLISGEWRSIIAREGDVLTPMATQGSNNFNYTASGVRNNFMDYVNSADGALPWQNEHVNKC